MTDVKVEQRDINEAEEFRAVLDSADAEYPSYAIDALAEILARHRQAAEKAQQERDVGIAKEWQSSLRPGSPERLAGHKEAATGIATAIRSQGHE